MLGAAAVLAASACGSELGPDPEDVVGLNGTYRATTFRVDGSSLLGSLELEILPGAPGEEDGATAGSFAVSGDPDGPDRALDLVGRWSFRQAGSGPTVELVFQHPDPLLDDLEALDFLVVAAGPRLEARAEVRGRAYDVVLEQT